MLSASAYSSKRSSSFEELDRTVPSRHIAARWGPRQNQLAAQVHGPQISLLVSSCFLRPQLETLKRWPSIITDLPAAESACIFGKARTLFSLEHWHANPLGMDSIKWMQM